MKTNLLIAFILLMRVGFGQPPCGSNPAAGNSCATATPICELNGYCGNTSASYTQNTWNQNCGFLGLSNCGLTGVFCGSIENNSFLSFTASSTTLSFNLWVTSSTMGYGIQILIFSANNCSGTVTQYGPCYNPGSVQPGPVAINATGLTIGNTYYIMIDGNAGDVCNYVIGANSGVSIPVNVTPTTSTICSGQTVALTATDGNGTYNWNASSQLNTTSGANVIATPPGPGTYTYTVNSAGGNPLCPSSTSATATITVNNCGCTITAGNSGPICTGGTLNLTSTTIANATYAWTGPSGFTSTAQNPTGVSPPAAPGTYTYTVTATVAGVPCTSSTTITVQAPTTTNANVDQSICAGGTINLSGVVGGSATTGTWSAPSGTFSNSTNLSSTYTPTISTGSVTLTLTSNTNGLCPATTDQMIISIIPNATANANIDQTVCQGGTITLAGSIGNGATTGTWTAPSGSFSNASSLTSTYTPSITTGSVTLTLTSNALGTCPPASDVMVVTITAAPIVNANTDQSVCEGGVINLNGSVSGGATTGTWSAPSGTFSNSTNLNSTYSPSISTGIVTLTLTANSGGNCPNSTDQLFITVENMPTVNANIDQSICEGGSINLSGVIGGGATSSLWSAPSGSFSNASAVNSTYTPTLTSGTVVLTLTANSSGLCPSVYDAMTLTINPLPIISAGNDISICPGSSVILTGSGGASYVWDNNGVNGVSFIPTASATYTVIGTSANGCTGTDQLLVTINPNPTISFAPDVTNGCVPLTVNFANSSANSGNCVWQLSDGTTINGCGPFTHTFTNPGCYNVSLTGTSANGCVSSLALNNLICVEANPIADFTTNPSIISELDPVVNFTNNSIGATIYSWDFGDNSNTSNLTSPTHSYQNQSAGTYSITLTAQSSFGCVDTAIRTITFKDELIYYVPNTFTPDGDEFNQYFLPVFHSGFDIYSYTMEIYNRWGEVVFETHDVKYGWNGTYGNTASNMNIVQQGVYTYRILFKVKENDEHRVVTGHVNLIK